MKPKPAKAQKRRSPAHAFDPRRMSAAAGAVLLGISERHFLRLVAAGVLPKGEGKRGFDGPAIINAWVEYQAADKEGSADVAASKATFWAARARRETLEADRLEGEIVRVDDVRALFSEVMIVIGAGLDSLPGRLAGELAGIADPAMIRKRILVEVRRVRADAAAKLESFGGAGASGDVASSAA